MDGFLFQPLEIILCDVHCLEKTFRIFPSIFTKYSRQVFRTIEDLCYFFHGKPVGLRDFASSGPPEIFYQENNYCQGFSFIKIPKGVKSIRKQYNM